MQIQKISNSTIGQKQKSNTQPNFNGTRIIKVATDNYAKAITPEITEEFSKKFSKLTPEILAKKVNKQADFEAGTIGANAMDAMRRLCNSIVEHTPIFAKNTEPTKGVFVFSFPQGHEKAEAALESNMALIQKQLPEGLIEHFINADALTMKEALVATEPVRPIGFKMVSPDGVPKGFKKL